MLIWGPQSRRGSGKFGARLATAALAYRFRPPRNWGPTKPPCGNFHNVTGFRPPRNWGPTKPKCKSALRPATGVNVQRSPLAPPSPAGLFAAAVPQPLALDFQIFSERLYAERRARPVQRFGDGPRIIKNFEHGPEAGDGYGGIHARRRHGRRLYHNGIRAAWRICPRRLRFRPAHAQLAAGRCPVPPAEIALGALPSGYPVGIRGGVDSQDRQKTLCLWWARRGLNTRPLPCESSALPLSYAPDTRPRAKGPFFVPEVIRTGRPPLSTCRRATG